MRIIGGDAKGRPLRAPRSAVVRPTSDRVKEAMFDILSSLDAIEGARVLDLFAGSGALGIEAFSRGAASVTFVETEAVAIDSIAANLDKLGAGHDPRVRVVQSDAFAFCSRDPARFDVALCDPPYRFSRWSELLEVLPANLVVLESSRPVEAAGNFVVKRVYRYGTTLLTVAKAARSEDADPDAP